MTNHDNLPQDPVRKPNLDDSDLYLSPSVGGLLENIKRIPIPIYPDRNKLIEKNPVRKDSDLYPYPPIGKSSRDTKLIIDPVKGTDLVNNPFLFPDIKVRQYVELVHTAGEAALMLEVADKVGINAASIDDPNKAADAAGLHALRRHTWQLTSHPGVDDQFEQDGKVASYKITARECVKNGGALIRFTCYEGQDLGEFYKELSARKELDTRQAEQQ